MPTRAKYMRLVDFSLLPLVARARETHPIPVTRGEARCCICMRRSIWMHRCMLNGCEPIWSACHFPFGRERHPRAAAAPPMRKLRVWIPRLSSLPRRLLASYPTQCAVDHVRALPLSISSSRENSRHESRVWLKNSRAEDIKKSHRIA